MRVRGKIEGTSMIPTPVLTQFFQKFQLRGFCFVRQYYYYAYAAKLQNKFVMAKRIALVAHNTLC
jgi:hypothetical protein